MVTIVGSTFTMGREDADHASPVQVNVTVGDFVMDAYEVTVARFRQFFNAGYQPWPNPIAYPNGSQLVVTEQTLIEPEETCKSSCKYNWSRTIADREAFPINRVHWNVAMSFCAWDGGRLPTEAEWEYAARGREVGTDLKSGRLYPWGDSAPTCDYANLAGCPLGDGPARVTPGRLPTAGIFDLAGNVAEWTADRFQEYGSFCWPGYLLESNPLCRDTSDARNVLRGGSYGSDANGLTLSFERKPSELRSAPVGMRCVRDIIQSSSQSVNSGSTATTSN